MIKQTYKRGTHAISSLARWQSGFSLIEILVTIAILAILLGLAMPSFTSIINSNRLSSAGNEFLATLQAARIEAIRRNARVVVCSSNNADSGAPTCATTGVIRGYVAFVDDGAGVASAARNDALDAGEAIVRANAMSDNLQIVVSPAVAATGSISYRSDGLAHATNGALLAGSVSICMATTTPAENVRTVQIGTGGSRVSVSKVDAPTNTCPAPTN